MISDKVIASVRVTPKKKFRLKDHDTKWSAVGVWKPNEKAAVREHAEALLAHSLTELAAAQEMLYADDRYALLIIFQAMDAAGKDGTIKHVMSGINPTGCQVYSFKRPSEEELDHTYLWRCMVRLPERGRIGIFNRSYYEEVLVVRVHPELLDFQKLPPGKRGKSFWQARYDDINAFEQHLTRNGTTVLKFFLNVSKEEQKRRFIERLEEPEKNWKFSEGDVNERDHWDEYMEAYEGAIRATSTEWAPWHVIPADDKWMTRAIVADVISSTLKSLDLRVPQPSPQQIEGMKRSLAKLRGE
jgi:PPK2 family polyphosphate:nucleotide phosphotransferase